MQQRRPAGWELQIDMERFIKTELERPASDTHD
jgi:hypothetical protein